MKIIITLLLASALFLTGCKSLEPFVKMAGDIAGQTAQQNLAPSQADSSSAIKQALGKGVSTAIASLGREGGFSATAFKIPLPEQVQSTADTARKLGLNKYVDEFELSMNQAAEKAVPVAADVFKGAIAQMSMQDVVGILTGGESAATDYFKRTSGSVLESKFKPIVTDATAKVGVTNHYKKMGDKVQKYGQFLGVSAPAAVDLDGYITQRSTDALFSKIADEEKLIRANPVQRTTELLQKVFGYYSKAKPAA